MDKDGWYLETGPFHRENDDKPTDSGVPMSALVSNKPKRQDQRGKDFGRRWGPVTKYPACRATRGPAFC